MDKDYELTVKSFFASVLEHVSEIRDLHKNPGTKHNIVEIQQKIINVEKLVFELIKLRSKKPKDNQALMDLQQKITKANNMEAFPAFAKPGSVDGAALGAYREAVNAIAEYYALPYQDWKKMMNAVKKWNYVTANGFMKKLMYKVSPASTFIMKDYTK